MAEDDLDILLSDIIEKDETEEEDKSGTPSSASRDFSNLDLPLADEKGAQKKTESSLDLDPEGSKDNSLKVVTDEIPELGDHKGTEIPIQYDIKRFESSLNEPLKSHIYAADSALNTINETPLSWDQQKIFDARRNDIIGMLEQIIHLHDKFYFALNQKNLIKEAERGYYAHFEGEQTKSRLEYLIFKESYQTLKSYNIQLRRNWTKLEKIFKEFSEQPEIKRFAIKLLGEKIEPMLLICDQTDELILRMQRILNISDEKIDKYSFNITIKATHEPNKIYRITECFTSTLAKDRELEITKKKIFGKLDEDFHPDEIKKEFRKKEELKEKLTLGSVKLGSVKDFSLDRVEKKIEDEKISHLKDSQGKSGHDASRIVLDLVGKKLWNQNKYYQLSISKSNLTTIEKKLKSCVYFTDRPHVNDESYIRKRIIIGMARKNRLNILKDIRDFLFNQLTLMLDEVSTFFEIPVNYKLLFAFHLGAHQVSIIQRKFIAFTQMSVCYISLPGAGRESKIIKEFFPDLIDESVKIFWDKRINPSYDESFDNFWEFSKISDLVRNKYFHELEINRRKLDTIFERVSLEKATSSQKERYFRNHFLDWFGLKNIYVYKRFIDKSIFSLWEAEIKNP